MIFPLAPKSDSQDNISLAVCLPDKKPPEA
jgi:hypothetical protein